MQVLFEDLTLDEAKVLVDALEHHRQLQTKLEIEAEEEMAKRREALERVIYGENEGRVFRNTNPDNGLEGHWITKAYPAVQAKETPIEDIRNTYTSAVLARHLSNPEVQGDLEACGQQGNRLGKLLAEEFKAAYEEQKREIERTGDLNTPLRLTANTLIDRSVQEAADLAYARSLTGCSSDDPNFTWPSVNDLGYQMYGGNYGDDTD